MSKLCRAQNNLEIMGCYKETKMLSEAQVQGWSESSSIPSHFRWEVPLTKMWIHAPGFTEHPLHWPWICQQMLYAPTRERKREGEAHLMRASKSEAIFAIATTAPTYLHLQNNKIFHILQSQKTTSDCSSSRRSYTANKSKFCELACFCNPNRKERNRTLVVHESIRLPPCLAPGSQAASVWPTQKIWQTKTKKDWQERKTATERLQQESTISLQALAFNSHSKQTLQLRHSMERRRKHMETETKAMLRFLPSKSTRNTTANPLRCFSYFTYHTFCSLSLSRGNLEERKNQQSRRTKTQQRSQRNEKEKEKSF